MNALAEKKSEAGQPRRRTQDVGPARVLVDADRKLLLAEIRRTTSVLRVDVYRMQPEEPEGDLVISADRFPIVRALVGRSGAVRIEQVGPALTEECDWALDAIKRYGTDCGWVKSEGQGTGPGG
jgi:hypothetical protein